VDELQEEAGGTTYDSDPAVDAVVAAIQENVGSQGQETLPEVPEIHTSIPILDLRDPHTWLAVIQDLFSGRVISLRKQDLTVVALEGAATGAALVTIIATLILRRS